MTSRIDIAKIGAGPCGLSAAAHLTALVGVAQRVFGAPLENTATYAQWILQCRSKIQNRYCAR
jgi:hypothetical protein